MEILKYFMTPYLKYFMKFLIFILVYLLCCSELPGIQPAPIDHREIFETFQKYFMKYLTKYFTPKKFMKFYITKCNIK